MKTFTTTAITKLGCYQVIVTVEKRKSPVTGISFWAYDGAITINNKTIPFTASAYNPSKIEVTFEMAKELNIAYKSGMVMMCDISEAVNYTRQEDKKICDMMTADKQCEQSYNFLHNL